MQEHLPPLDTHEESYFASFTDMLIGIIFIFIILLMIVANNYQEATEAVTQANQALQEARNQARDTERDKIRDAERDKLRDEERDKLRDEAHNKEISQLKAEADAKILETVKALAEVKALEAAKDLQEAKAREITASMQNTQGVKGIQGIPGIQGTSGISDETPASAAKANDEVITRRLTDTQQNIFNDSRAKLLAKIQEEMNLQGFPVTANINQGTLLVPENILFDSNTNQGELNYRGKQALYTLANLFGKYLPCISPTTNVSRLSDCDSLGFIPNDGLDVIFIDDYPDIAASREDILLLAVRRVVSVFNELKANEPYLDRQLKNIAGTPILDIKVNQERRRGLNQKQQKNLAVKNFVVLRFIMRKPNQADVHRLKNPL